jgi:hypothetical protein
MGVHVLKLYIKNKDIHVVYFEKLYYSLKLHPNPFL